MLAAALAVPGLARAQEAERGSALIPRAALFAPVAYRSPALSADGTMLAYLAPDAAGAYQIWLRSIGAHDDRQVTSEDIPGIQEFVWTADGRHIVYPLDVNGDERYRLYLLDTVTAGSQPVTPPDAHASLLTRSAARPSELLVTIYNSESRLQDVHRLDLQSGRLRLDTRNPGAVHGWIADDSLQVRGAITRDDAAVGLLVRTSPAAPWILRRSWDRDADVDGLGFSADGRAIYLVSDAGAKARRLISIDASTGVETVLAEDPNADILSGLWFRARPAAVLVVREYAEWRGLEPSVASDLALLDDQLPPQYWVESTDARDELWTVRHDPAGAGPRYLLYHRAARTLTPLFEAQPTLNHYALPTPTPIAFSARDGRELHGYLTLPIEQTMSLPTVVLVHGGPWERDYWGVDPEVAWLADRGYAVLQVNFRGSTGYGRDLREAGYGEWGRGMLDDLVDGLLWLAEQGIADPDRAGIMGWSYGGYAAMAALTLSPDTFAAGVAGGRHQRLALVCRLGHRFTRRTLLDVAGWRPRA